VSNCRELGSAADRERLSSAAVISMALSLVILLVLIYFVTWVVYALCHPETKYGSWMRLVRRSLVFTDFVKSLRPKNKDSGLIRVQCRT